MASKVSSEAFEALKYYLINEHNAKPASGGKEVVKRCHFCGDSRDPTSRHLYIGLTAEGIIKFNCFKCNSGGTVDGKFLRDMGCYDTNLILLCNELNQKSSNSNTSRSGRFRREVMQNTPHFFARDDEFTERKLSYISKRMGIEFTVQMCAQFKIILNLKDFLMANNITQYTRSPNLIDELDKFFIGFLSMDNCYITMRRLVPEGKVSKYIDTRYLNYNIYGMTDNSMRYYTIPTLVNPTMPLDIHIAEGGFDILSIYTNLPHVSENGIYASIGGKSYAALVRFFIINYGFTGFNLHLYPDADIGLNKMQAIRDEVRPFNVTVYIHSNTSPGEKDYGVSKDRIIDSVTRI